MFQERVDEEIEDSVEELRQEIQSLNRTLSNRERQIHDLREQQESITAIGPNPGQSIDPPAPNLGQPIIQNAANVNIDKECQRGKIPDLI
jgi:hypothetical protein